jgi:protein-L-isoaspartate O-methyltransferase
MFLDSDDPTDLVYEYTKYYSLYKVFKPDVRNALVIGGGAYSIPKALLAELPNAAVDVSEIEPSLFDLAKEYFDLEESPNLHNYTEDGRRLLQDSNKGYDLILAIYKGGSPMSTWSFVTNHGGVLILVAKYPQITAREIADKRLTPKSNHVEPVVRTEG